MAANKKICMLGLGYIGLPTAVLLANSGYDVHGVDINPVVIDRVNKGQLHINEPGLDTLLEQAVNSGKLKAYNTPAQADIYIIAVPTPFKGDHEPDISYVLSATRALAPFLRKGNMLINESTSPVGTLEKIEEELKTVGCDTTGVHMAYCPERVLPGNAIKELVENSRLVGGLNTDSAKIVAEFYRTYIKGLILETDSRTAELVKLTENSYRDVNIAFANEISIICDKYGINPYNMIDLANMHPRVNILKPGCGVGGHCIAVDPWFIVADNPNEANMIKTARLTNLGKTKWVVDKIRETASIVNKTTGRSPLIACMGLSFKPDIDDLRESPALDITKDLIAQSYNIIANEPNIESFHGINLTDHKTAVKEADIVVLLVSHKEYKNLEIDESKIVLDFCGVFS